jgi:hypothetical protein
MRGLNPRPWAHKTHALPAELIERIHEVGFEPTKHYARQLKCRSFDRSEIRVCVTGFISYALYLLSYNRCFKLTE